MRVFFSWAPTRFVVEHEKHIPLFFVVKLSKIFFEVTKAQQAGWNKVVFYAFVLEIPVYGLYVFQILESEW